MTANSSPFTAGNPPAPEDAQVAFLQGTASLSQPIRGLTPGMVYRIEFYCAQRKNRLDGGQTWDLEKGSPIRG